MRWEAERVGIVTALLVAGVLAGLVLGQLLAPGDPCPQREGVPNCAAGRGPVSLAYWLVWSFGGGLTGVVIGGILQRVVLRRGRCGGGVSERPKAPRAS